MLYRNKKTGAMIDIKSEATGAWEPVEKEQKEVKKKAPKKKTTGKDK